MARPGPLTPTVSQESFTVSSDEVRSVPKLRALQGVLWGATAVSAVFVLFRIFVRLKVFRRLWVDDAMVILAWVLLLISAILWQTQVDALYTQHKLVAGTVYPTPQVLHSQEVYERSLAALFVFFYTCLFAVKLSFLFFFRRLGTNVRGQRIWWWTVFAINIAVWITLIRSLDWACMVSPLDYIFSGQCDKTSTLEFQHRTFVYSCAIDVVTDALIITIPIALLWKIKLPLAQKLALMGLLFLTTFVMLVSIIRVAVLRNSSRTQAEPGWQFLWANVEMGVGKKDWFRIHHRRLTRASYHHRLYCVLPPVVYEAGKTTAYSACGGGTQYLSPEAVVKSPFQVVFTNDQPYYVQSFFRHEVGFAIL
ncbi:MAG: hypothetical protein Q9168_004325 [Polycauliona sp. 1 TL-2023]